MNRKKYSAKKGKNLKTRNEVYRTDLCVRDVILWLSKGGLYSIYEVATLNTKKNCETYKLCTASVFFEPEIETKTIA